MDKVGLVLEQFVDAFYYISLAQHHLVPQGHKLVFHVRLEPVNKMDTLVEEVFKEFLLDVPLVGKHFAVEHFGEDLPHHGIPVVHVCGSQAEGEHVAHLVAQQMQLETMTPAHRSLSVLGKSIKDLVEFPPHVVAYGYHRTVYETNARALSKTLDAHEGHQVEEHAGHEFHEARVGHGLWEVACQMFLDEKEVIVLEVAE